jgi:diacylglycerol kinase
MKSKKFSIRDRLKSFVPAFHGLKTLFREEHNALIHLVAAICAIIAGFAFGLSAGEWVAIAFAIGFVFAMEFLNTSIEKLADFVAPEKNEKIKDIKDLAAAGVLIAAISAFAIALIIFIPKILNLC